MFWKKWYFDKFVEFGLLLLSFEWCAYSYKCPFKLLHPLLSHIDLHLKHILPYQSWSLLISMIVAYVARIEHRQDWIKISFQDSLWGGFLWREVLRNACGQGSFGERFPGLPVGGSWKDSWGGGSPKKKLTILFFSPPGDPLLIRQPRQWSSQSGRSSRSGRSNRSGRSSRAGRASRAGRSSRAGRAGRSDRKEKTPTTILFRREKPKNTMIMIYIYTVHI